LFQLLNGVVQDLTTWLVSALKTTAGISINNTSIWICLFFVCFFITFLIRKFIVQPLGFYIRDEGAPSWELFVLVLLVLGFYIYLLNQVFDQPMPSSWPTSLLKLVDGYENTFANAGNAPLEERNTWSVVPWLWNIGPIGFMFVRTRLMKDKDER
jgi:hypothetical protein